MKYWQKWIKKSGLISQIEMESTFQESTFQFREIRY